jgi:PAS domain S-box-containing protein
MQPNTVPTLDAARVLDALEQAVVAIAPSGEVALFSAGAELLLGLSAAAAIGRSACDLLARPADGEAALERARRDGAWSGDLQVRGNDGALLPVRTRLVALRDSAGEPAGWVATLTDPRAAAGIDALTGLPTRDRFADEVRRAVEAMVPGGELDVLAVTLDSFDAINESLGHSAGDSLMREAATRLREAAGPEGLVARQSAA